MSVNVQILNGATAAATAVPNIYESQDQLMRKYGNLVILGYNGCLKPEKQQQSGRRRSKFELRKQVIANGVQLSNRRAIVNRASEQNIATNDCKQVNASVSRETNEHAIVYTFGNENTTKIGEQGRAGVVCEREITVYYEKDQNSDMFQIGRSADKSIHFVVDTNCEVSRYAARIIVDRCWPHEARIYAAAFNSDNTINVGRDKLKWLKDKETDGFTSNGVYIMQTNFPDCRAKGLWREVSIEGVLYPMREDRHNPQPLPRVRILSRLTQYGMKKYQLYVKKMRTPSDRCVYNWHLKVYDTMFRSNMRVIYYKTVR